MCAGTVVEPAVPTSAVSVSVTSRSRSVAFRLRREFSARRRTLPRIGIVLRRSTTRWTCPSDLSSCARSTVTFITLDPLIDGVRRAASWERRHTSWRVPQTRRGGSQGGADGARAQGLSPAPGCFSQDDFSQFLDYFPRFVSLLELALQKLDFVGQHGIPGNQRFNLAHRVQHSGVVAPTEAAADLRQRAQR